MKFLMFPAASGSLSIFICCTLTLISLLFSKGNSKTSPFWLYYQNHCALSSLKRHSSVRPECPGITKLINPSPNCTKMPWAVWCYIVPWSTSFTCGLKHNKSISALILTEADPQIITLLVSWVFTWFILWTDTQNPTFYMSFWWYLSIISSLR